MSEDSNEIRLQQCLTPEQQERLEELEQMFTCHTMLIASLFALSFGVPGKLSERDGVPDDSEPRIITLAQCDQDPTTEESNGRD